MDFVGLVTLLMLFAVYVLYRDSCERPVTGWAMSDNAYKTPLGWSLNNFVDAKTGSALNSLTKSLPCHVTKIVSSGIVEIAFDMDTKYTLPAGITMPVATAEYVRLPVQVGDKGWAIGADAYLGGVTGLGGGVADFTRRGNLTALVFHPLGNTKWSEVDNDSLILYGPNGVVIEDTGKNTVITLTGGSRPEGVPACAQPLCRQEGTDQANTQVGWTGTLPTFLEQFVNKQMAMAKSALKIDINAAGDITITPQSG